MLRRMTHSSRVQGSGPGASSCFSRFQQLHKGVLLGLEFRVLTNPNSLTLNPHLSIWGFWVQAWGLGLEVQASRVRSLRTFRDIGVILGLY